MVTPRSSDVAEIGLTPQQNLYLAKKSFDAAMFAAYDAWQRCRDACGYREADQISFSYGERMLVQAMQELAKAQVALGIAELSYKALHAPKEKTSPEAAMDFPPHIEAVEGDC